MKKAVDLLGKIPCGSGYVPGKVRVLDYLLEPGEAIELDMMESGGGSENDGNQTPKALLNFNLQVWRCAVL